MSNAAAIQAFEDGKLSAFLNTVSAGESIDGMTYRELHDAADEASENCDWSLMDMYRAAITERAESTNAALVKLFHEQLNGGKLPVVEGRKISSVFMLQWLLDAFRLESGAQDAAQMLMDESARAAVLAHLAQEYADDNCEDLLLAGWSAQ